MSYKIEISPAANRELRKIPAKVRDSLLLRLAELSDDPRPQGAKKLAAPQNLWRIREDDYRLIYLIRDETLLVLTLRIGHRKEVYRQLSRLLQTIPK